MEVRGEQDIKIDFRWRDGHGCFTCHGLQVTVTVMDFGGSWEDHLSLGEFACNNNYQATILIALYEALSDHHYAGWRLGRGGYWDWLQVLVRRFFRRPLIRLCWSDAIFLVHKVGRKSMLTSVGSLWSSRLGLMSSLESSPKEDYRGQAGWGS